MRSNNKLLKNLLSTFLLGLVGIVVTSTITGCQSAHASDSGASTYNDWAWFKDTYWVVSEEGLPAIIHSTTNPSQFNVIRDQTVFHLTDYFNGYFTGVVAAQLTESGSVSCQYVLGEVTPEGEVYLSMFNAQDGSLLNTPVGKMVQVNGEWTMVNMMTAPSSSGVSVSHWAYMYQSSPGKPTWDDLPFVHQSVLDFVANCPAGPTIGL